MRLEGKVAFISGGAQGMGATEARMFAREGAKVAIGDVLPEGESVAREIEDAGGECLFTPLDVTSESEWQAAIAATVARFGRLDVLVNNAGVSQWGLVHETSEADWDRVMDINAKGVFLGTKAAIPAMLEAGGGSIVNISSQLGLVGDGDVESTVPVVEGRGQTANEADGYAVREGWDTVQLGASGADHDAYDRAAPRGRDDVCRDAGADSTGPVRRAGGDRERRPVPGVGRVGVDDGERACAGRGMDGAVKL